MQMIRIVNLGPGTEAPGGAVRVRKNAERYLASEGEVHAASWRGSSHTFPPLP